MSEQSIVRVTGYVCSLWSVGMAFYVKYYKFYLKKVFISSVKRLHITLHINGLV